MRVHARAVGLTDRTGRDGMPVRAAVDPEACMGALDVAWRAYRMSKTAAQALFRVLPGGVDIYAGSSLEVQSWAQSRALRHRWLRSVDPRGSAVLVFQTMPAVGGLPPLLLPGISAAFGSSSALVGASAAISAAASGGEADDVHEDVEAEVGDVEIERPLPHEERRPARAGVGAKRRLGSSLSGSSSTDNDAKRSRAAAEAAAERQFAATMMLADGLPHMDRLAAQSAATVRFAAAIANDGDDDDNGFRRKR